jgi:hypothetical protein
MAADDYRLDVGFFDHHKIKKLIRQCDYRGPVGLQRIYAHTTKHKPDGRLSGMTAEDIEIVADWDPQRPGELVKALVDLRLLDFDGETYTIHNWAKRNPWVVGSQARSDHARRANEARLQRKRAAQSPDEQYSNEKGAVLGAETGNAPLLSESESDSSPKHDPNPEEKPLPLVLNGNGIGNSQKAEEKIVQTWNALGSPFSRIKKLTPDRKQHLSARLKEHGLAECEQALQAIHDAAFCRGENDRRWVADFDWFLKPGTIVKVLEGKYTRDFSNDQPGTWGKDLKSYLCEPERPRPLLKDEVRKSMGEAPYLSPGRQRLHDSIQKLQAEEAAAREPRLVNADDNTLSHKAN